MNRFTQIVANVISALIATWMGILATGRIPDTNTTRLISLVACGLQIFMTNMGFQRTPSGNIIPPSVKRFVDEAAKDKTVETD